MSAAFYNLNLYDKNRIDGEDVGYIDRTTGLPVGNAAYQYTPFISVVAGETYACNSIAGFLSDAGWVVYDNTFTFLSSGQTAQITIPTGGKYLRATIAVSFGKDNFMLTEGPVLSPIYYPYNSLAPRNAPAIKSFLYDKTLSTHGDSITELGGYQPVVQLALGLATVNNYGKSGSILAGTDPTDSICWKFVNVAQDETADVVILNGGTNVGGYGLGTIDDTDYTTVYGALNLACQWFFVNMPNSKLVIMTCIGRSSVGETQLSHAQALRDIAKKYSLPLIDLFYELGICPQTASKFLYDGTHPNSVGFNLMGQFIAKKLDQLTIVN